jgi:hypothetical protein
MYYAESALIQCVCGLEIWKGAAEQCNADKIEVPAVRLDWIRQAAMAMTAYNRWCPSKPRRRSAVRSHCCVPELSIPIATLPQANGINTLLCRSSTVSKFQAVMSVRMT